MYRPRISFTILCSGTWAASLQLVQARPDAQIRVIGQKPPRSAMWAEHAGSMSDSSPWYVTTWRPE